MIPQIFGDKSGRACRASPHPTSPMAMGEEKIQISAHLGDPRSVPLLPHGHLGTGSIARTLWDHSHCVGSSDR